MANAPETGAPPCSASTTAERAESRGRSQHRADIMRVADLIERHNHRSTRRRRRLLQHLIEVVGDERLDIERKPLMHSALG